MISHDAASSDKVSGQGMFDDEREAAVTDGSMTGKLQSRHIVLAASADGLKGGPLRGFATNGIEEAVFVADPARRSWRANAAGKIGCGARSDFRRLPRFDFTSACVIL